MAERAVQCLVSGRVQGVGFRWFVQQEARRLGVRGDVRNLPDGRVEIRAVGAAEDVGRLLAAVGAGPTGSKPEDVVTRELSSTSSFEGFEVRF